MARTAMDEYFGGSVDLVPVSDYNLPLPSGVPGAVRMHVLRPGVSSLNVVLPAATSCPRARGGEPTFTVINFGAHAMTLRDTLGTSITTIGIDEVVQVMLQDASTAAGVWIFRKTTGAVESASGIPNVGQPFSLALQSGVDVDLRDLCDQAGYVGDVPATVTAGLFVPPGGSIALIGASSTSGYALRTGRFPAGSTIQINIGAGAYLVGRGGDGGAGASAYGPATDGQGGGAAIFIEAPTLLFNYGSILGGGGGGAGDASVAATGSAPGGGGGAGYEVSVGGYSQNPSSSGGPGGLLAPGHAGSLGGVYLGGAGGSAGVAGGTSTSGTAVGGAGGSSIVVETSGSGSLSKIVPGTITGSEVTV